MRDGSGFSVLPAKGQVHELLQLTGLTNSIPIIEGVPTGNGHRFEAK
jgi:hypothetical protein